MGNKTLKDGTSQQIIADFQTAVKDLKPYLQRGDRKTIVQLLKDKGHDYSIESVNKAVNGQTSNLIIAKFTLKFLKKRKKEFIEVTNAAVELKKELEAV